MEQPPRRAARHHRLGAAITVAVIAVGAWSIHAARPAHHTDIMLLYVGAEDCAPCRAWQKGEGASFLASAASSRIRYREVKSPHLGDVLNDENWPKDLQVYRSRLKRSDGVPLWMVIADDEVVDHRFGAPAWRESILPTLNGLLRPSRIWPLAGSRATEATHGTRASA